MRVVAAWLVALALAPLPAFADGGGGEDQARVLFERGTTALRSGRVAEARDLFRDSLDALPTAPTAFNLAVALRGTGETSAAVALFDALLEGRYGALSDERHREVAQLRRAADDERADLLVVNRADFAVHVEVTRTDGRPVAAPSGRFEVAARGRETVRLDSGSHDLRATADGHADATHRLELTRSRRTTWEPALTVALETDPVQPPETPRSTSPRRGRGLLGEPWFWIAGGALTAAAIGVTAWLALRDDTGEPVSDEFFGVVEALTFDP